MSNLIDLTGKTFGNLVVIEKDNKKSSTGSYWICQCSCGNIKSIRSAHLRNGSIQSCGCLRKQILSNLKVKDLTGQRFGNLTVLMRSSNKTSDGRIKWICLCDCGNTTEVLGKDLKSYHTISCGCIHRSTGEILIEQILQQNNISYISQYRFLDFNKRIYDFAILDKSNKVIQLIEYDGEQHFKEIDFFKETLKERQKRDEEKNLYAEEHQIPLVRIPYTLKNKISLDLILTEEVKKIWITTI